MNWAADKIMNFVVSFPLLPAPFFLLTKTDIKILGGAWERKKMQMLFVLKRLYSLKRQRTCMEIYSFFICKEIRPCFQWIASLLFGRLCIISYKQRMRFHFPGIFCLFREHFRNCIHHVKLFLFLNMLVPEMNQLLPFSCLFVCVTINAIADTSFLVIWFLPTFSPFFSLSSI